MLQKGANPRCRMAKNTRQNAPIRLLLGFVLATKVPIRPCKFLGSVLRDACRGICHASASDLILASGTLNAHFGLEMGQMVLLELVLYRVCTGCFHIGQVLLVLHFSIISQPSMRLLTTCGQGVGVNEDVTDSRSPTIGLVDRFHHLGKCNLQKQMLKVGLTNGQKWCKCGQIKHNDARCCWCQRAVPTAIAWWLAIHWANWHRHRGLVAPCRCAP